MSTSEEITPLTSNVNIHNASLESGVSTINSKLSATVKSSDGKIHKVIFDLHAKTLEFTLLK